MGSQGRKEQLLLTDQDNAIVFEDVPEEKYDAVKNYFIDLDVVVDETIEVKVVLSPREKLDKLLKEKPVFALLKEKLKLDAIYDAVKNFNNQFKNANIPALQL